MADIDYSTTAKPYWSSSAGLGAVIPIVGHRVNLWHQSQLHGINRLHQAAFLRSFSPSCQTYLTYMSFVGRWRRLKPLRLRVSTSSQHLLSRTSFVSLIIYFHLRFTFLTSCFPSLCLSGTAVDYLITLPLRKYTHTQSRAFHLSSISFAPGGGREGGEERRLLKEVIVYNQSQMLPQSCLFILGEMELLLVLCECVCLCVCCCCAHLFFFFFFSRFYLSSVVGELTPYWAAK